MTTTVSHNSLALARPARLDDVPYIEALRSKMTYELGFIPKIALQSRIAGTLGGGCMLAIENDDPCGFLHYGSTRGAEVRIFQAAIQFDAQRRHHGLNLVDKLVSHCENAGARYLSLRCLSDLPANDFWEEAGFRWGGAEHGAKGPLVIWVRHLRLPDNYDPNKVYPSFHQRSHACPDCGRKTTDTWTAGARRWATCPRCTSARMLKLMANAGMDGGDIAPVRPRGLGRSDE